MQSCSCIPIREIYGNVSASYQVETSARICNYLDGWVNIDWFSKEGHSDSFEEKTNVSILNLSLGVKFPYRFYQNFVAYVGLGPACSRIWIENKSHLYHEKVSKVAFGGVIKMGVCYFIYSSIFVDVFIDYLYQTVHFDKQINIGGCKPGLGIGAVF